MRRPLVVLLIVLVLHPTLGLTLNSTRALAVDQPTSGINPGNSLQPVVPHPVPPGYPSNFQDREKVFSEEEAQIPQSPSIPPSLNQKKANASPHCERFFLYQGKKIECDSNLGRNAEHLRPLISDVPAALSELNTYQSNRAAAKNAAYIGSIGLLVTIIGIAISRPPFEPGTGAIKPGGYFVLGGLGLSINSLIYGLSAVKNNEAHIDRAVQYYNAAHPSNPIELQFSTTVNF